MKKIILNLLIFSLLLFVISCSKDKDVKQSQEVSKKVSKDKNDWCDEHNIPESQCSICNPALAEKLSISSESKSLIGIKTEKAQFRTFQSKIFATGKITYNEKRLTHITSRVSGRIEEVFAFLQSKVKMNEPLVSIYSPEYLTAQSEFIQAEERLKRTKQIKNSDEESTAKAIFDSSKQKLIIIGVSDEEIVELEKTHAIQSYLTLHSPFSGTIVESNIIHGEFIQQGTNLYKLADLSKLWIIADIYEKNIRDVKIGQIAEINTSVYPDEIFTGRITAVGDVLDEKTRTFKLRIEVENLDGKLKPEMFVKVVIITSQSSILIVPKNSVLTDEEHKIVFVAMDTNNFIRKEVKLGKETNETVEVISGLKEGENIVTEGNFLLKSELLKSKMGAGCAE